MQKVIILLILCFGINISCVNQEERAEKTIAERVISAMTPGRLAALQQWTYSGTGNTWYKGSMAQVETTARFEERNDSLILTVRKPAAFIRDFQLDIAVEERLHGLTLVQSVDTCFFISEDALIGPYWWTTLDCSTDTIFKRGSPFHFFRDLTQWKDSVGIVKMEPGPGEVIQFYLQEGWVLSYLPAGSSESLPGEWRDELARGEMIEQNWNLRRDNKLRSAP